MAGWLGVGLAELGRFSALTLISLVLLAASLLALRLSCIPGRRGWPLDMLRPGHWHHPRELAALLVLLALAGLLFAQPGEDILGGRDPGIYFATGLAIADHGSILQHDWSLRALGSDLGETSINWWLFQSVHGWPLRFPGQLFVRDLPAGEVEPGFLPWYPAAIALAIAGGGLPAGLWVNPALATLSLVAVFLVGRSLFTVGVGTVCAGWLALNLAQVWFARYTMAEPAAQFLIWTGLYALIRARQRPDGALGVLAGLAWGGLCLTRVEAVLLVPPVAVYLGLLTRQQRHRSWALLALGLLVAGALHAGWHAWRFAPGYSTMVFSRATLAVAAGGVALALSLAG